MHLFAISFNVFYCSIDLLDYTDSFIVKIIIFYFKSESIGSKELFIIYQNIVLNLGTKIQFWKTENIYSLG